MRTTQVLSPIAVQVGTAAKMLDTPVSTVRFFCQTGRIPARKIGKGWLIRLDALQELTQTHDASSAK